MLALSDRIMLSWLDMESVRGGPTDVDLMRFLSSVVYMPMLNTLSVDRQNYTTYYTSLMILLFSYMTTKKHIHFFYFAVTCPIVFVYHSSLPRMIDLTTVNTTLLFLHIHCDSKVTLPKWKIICIY